MIKRSRFPDFPAGHVFGDRTVIGPAPTKNGYRRLMMRCKCGAENAVDVAQLVRHGSPCCKECARRKNGVASKRWMGGRYISLTLYSRWQKSAIKRNIPWCINMQYLDTLLEKQKFKCAFTGDDLTFDRACRHDGNASLDRTDSSQGYIEGNVLFSTKIVNIAKQSLSYSEFVDMCIRITQNHVCE